MTYREKIFELLEESKDPQDFLAKEGKAILDMFREISKEERDTLSDSLMDRVTKVIAFITFSLFIPPDKLEEYVDDKGMFAFGRIECNCIACREARKTKS